MLNPKDISDPATAIDMTLVLMAKTFKLNYSTPTNNNQRISSNPHNRQIAKPSMHMRQDKQMQMVAGNGRNQFRQYARQNVGNQNSKIANSEKRIRIGIVMIMRHKRLKVIERDKQKSDTVLTTQSVGTLQKEAMNPARPDAKAIVFRIIVALDLSKGTNPLQAKGSRSIQSMRMRQYICHTDHNLWDIIIYGDLQEEAAPAGEQSSPPAPKTAK
ncbi:hypothetical protein Tco_0624947 [Tanacetum coccineum]|uniref:Gag-Pol polyprotein n=1 Tax=Tanacetum coccineum TaxID=301880 RepID=A0ABQ4WFD5_9ASTR